jgi:hypothetical protein
MSKPLRRPTYDGIKDERVRDALQALHDYLANLPLLLSQFEHFQITTQSNAEISVPHRLGFKPKDLILSSAMAADDGDQMAVTFNYKDTNNTNIVLSTAEAGTIRFYAGTYDTENV